MLKNVIKMFIILLILASNVLLVFSVANMQIMGGMDGHSCSVPLMQLQLGSGHDNPFSWFLQHFSFFQSLTQMTIAMDISLVVFLFATVICNAFRNYHSRGAFYDVWFSSAVRWRFRRIVRLFSLQKLFRWLAMHQKQGDDSSVFMVHAPTCR